MKRAGHYQIESLAIAAHLKELRANLSLILFALLLLLFGVGCDLIDNAIKGEIGGKPSDSLPPNNTPAPGSESESGTLDPTFNSSGIVVYSGEYDSIGMGIGVDSSLRILVGGAYGESLGNASSAQVWAYNQNGTLDSSFASGGVFTETVNNWVKGRDFLVDSLGKLVMGGNKEWGGTDDPTYWVLNADGSLYTSISNSNYAGEVQGAGIAEDKVNGGYYQTGFLYPHNSMTISKKSYLLVNQTSFGGTGRISFNSIPYSAGWRVKADSNGKAVIIGESSPTSSTSNYDLTVWRYNVNGTLDTSFNTLGYFTHDGAAGSLASQEYAGGLAFDSLGDIFVTGASYNGSDYDMVVWKIKETDGSLDTSFNGIGYKVFKNVGAAVGNDKGKAIIIDSDDNIFIAGTGQDSGGFEDVCLWKLDRYGNLDTSFSTDGTYCVGNIAGGNGDDTPIAVTLDSIGKIMVTGNSFNGTLKDMFILRIQ